MTSEQERAELHRVIWQMANELRGSVDGWDFKAYVLGMLFYRFISENITHFINAGEDNDFDYTQFSDDEAESGREETIKDKGFYILPSELFCNVRKNANNDDNLNETLHRVFKNIENSAKGTASEELFKGLFDDLDVNSPKLGTTVKERNHKLTRIMDAIGDLRLGTYQQHSIDTFGDAYEYLMNMYASNAGKSGGEFFTPQEVSELLAKITTQGKQKVKKVYDPACGSGSLLLQIAKVAGKDTVEEFYGQEINITTYNLCRINMLLHDINYTKINIAHGDTLLYPSSEHDEARPFDVVVSNPPYSIKWAGDSNPILINDERFSPAGILAPKSKADLAFVMHILSWLAPDGVAAIVEFPGVLYRGGAEKKIRQYLIDNNYIDTVIQLPANLFFGVSIATCIIVLKRSKTNNDVLFIDASNEYIKATNKNQLSPDNIENILKVYTERTSKEYFSNIVSNVDIANNDYSLSVSSYVAQEDTREEIDIVELNKEIAEIVAKQNILRSAIDAIVADLEGMNNE